MEKNRGERLAVITAWRSGELVGVWPLFTYRQNGVVAAKHLGSGSDEEYGGPLVHDDETGTEVADAVLRQAVQLADVLYVFNVPVDSPVARSLKSRRTLKYVGVQNSPVATLRTFGSWDEWLESKSHNFRKQARQKRRRMAAAGALEAAALTEPSEAKGLVDWLFDIKAAQLTARGIRESWIFGSRGRRFFQELVSQPHGMARTHALKLDGKIVAGYLSLVSDESLETYVTGFDSGLDAHSPGLVLLQVVFDDAIESGLDVDFRLTAEPYKLHWTDGYEQYNTFVVACSVLGVPTVGQRLLRTVIAQARMKLGPWKWRLIALAKSRSGRGEHR
jgi:CelD/BcsL family acetyltransferase involved in cellulose biosynthesis